MRNRIQRFMMGRYGDDSLNRFLLGLVVVMIVVNWFAQSTILQVVYSIFFIFYMYRFYSKNIVRRTLERDRYNHIVSWIRHHAMVFTKNRREKDSRYVVCPKCTQMIRVPRNKGRIEITCKQCHTKFEKKV